MEFENSDSSEISSLISDLEVSVASAVCGAVNSWDVLEVGREIEATIVCIDAVGHSELMKKYGKDFHEAIERYRDLVKNCIRSYDGRDWHWAGDGCICAFWGERRRERAVLAGLKLLHEMTLFNLDPLKNPLPSALKIRIAANDGEVAYKIPEGEIAAVVINEAAKLESGRTRAGEFNIYGSVFHPMDKRLRAVFNLVDEGFREQEVYTYVGVKKDEHPSDAKVEEMIATCIQLVGNISKSARSIFSEHIDRDTAASINSETRHFYQTVAGFVDSFRVADERWSSKYQRWLISKVVQFSILEESLWKEMKRLLNTVRPGPEASEEFHLLRSSLLNTHAQSEVNLDRLKNVLERLQGSGASESSLLEERISTFLSADELDITAAFVSLIELGIDGIVPFLSLAKDDTFGERSRLLAVKFWEVADLLLIEERRQLPEGQQASVEFVPGGLLSILAENAKVGGYFKTLLYFMEDRPALPDLVVGKMRSMRIQPKYEDPDIILRALLAAHPAVTARFRAAEVSKFSSLCQIATYPRAPLSSIWVLSERVATLSSNDAKRIFFDCVKPILAASLEGDRWIKNFDVIGQIIKSLFKFDVFVEDAYFRELEAILTTYRARAARVHKKVDMLAPGYSVLRGKRSVPGGSVKHGMVPDGLVGLSDPVLRHLARTGSYVAYFACHKEARIAAESVRYLSTPEAVENLLVFCAESGEEPNRIVVDRIPPEMLVDVLARRETSTSADSNEAGRFGDTNLLRELKKRFSKSELDRWQSQKGLR